MDKFIEALNRLPYIKAVRDISRGSEKFVALSDVLKMAELSDAVCPPGSTRIPCGEPGCMKTASFIQNRRALCLEHALLP